MQLVLVVLLRVMFSVSDRDFSTRLERCMCRAKRPKWNLGYAVGYRDAKAIELKHFIVQQLFDSKTLLANQNYCESYV